MQPPGQEIMQKPLKCPCDPLTLTYLSVIFNLKDTEKGGNHDGNDGVS